MTASVVILAAGRGERMGMNENKILAPIRGQALICHTVSAFARISELDEVIVVVHPDEMDRVRRLIQQITSQFQLVEGGETRRDSALAGVRAASGDLVLIHDGARPFPSSTLIQHVLTAARRESAVVPVLRIFDLVYRVGTAERIEKMSDLSGQSLAQAQTPQGFRRDLILRCLEAASSEIRDDATAVLLAGESVGTVHGEPANIKITRPEDLALAEAIAASRN